MVKILKVPDCQVLVYVYTFKKTFTFKVKKCRGFDHVDMVLVVFVNKFVLFLD